MGPYASLNLGFSSGDESAAVAENRRRVLAQFGDPPLATLRQVHGVTVQPVETAGEWRGDGLLSATPGLLLAVQVADCLPLLMEDPASGAVAALHAGWRGALGNILAAAVALFVEKFNSRPRDLRLAAGPGIAASCYQVDAELAQRFTDAGWPQAVLADDQPGKARLDLAAVVKAQALALGLPPENLWFAGICSHCHPELYSYRRDGEASGRLWGVIQAGGKR